MTGSELRSRRTELGVTVDELAESLGEHVDEVLRYEMTGGSLPKGLTVRLNYALATIDRENRLAAAGLRQCPEVERIIASLPRKMSKETVALLESAERHMKSCERCSAREALIATLPPLPPRPIPTTLRVLRWLEGQIGRLPKMLRPAAWGAIFIGGMTSLRALPALLFRPNQGLMVLGAVAAAIGLGAYGGAVGGVTYGLIRPRTTQWGRLGDYLTGIVCAFAYLIALAIPLDLFTDEAMFRTRVGWVIGIVLSIVFGLVIGHQFRGGPAPAAGHESFGQ